MRYKIAIVLLLQVLLVCPSWSQEIENNNVVEISFDYGYSNDGHEMKRYGSGNFGENLLLDKREARFLYNYRFAYSRFFNEEHGLKLSFGQAEFGFHYEGTNEVTGSCVKGSMKIRLLEFGLAYVHRFEVLPSYFLVIEPGLRYHSDGSLSTDGLRFSRRDAFSFSGYVGLEFPLINEKLYSTLGIQLSLPIDQYSYTFSNQQPYYPYFVGLRLGFNFRFKAF